MKLPLEYKWLIAHNFQGFTPWYLVNPLDSDGVRKEFQVETGNDIIPFARRQDNDDIAGFEILNGQISSKVLTVHLTWSNNREKAGYPITKYSDDIFEWLSSVVIPATKDWMSEEDLVDLNENDNGF